MVWTLGARTLAVEMGGRERERDQPIRGKRKKKVKTATIAGRLDIEIKGKEYIKHTF